MGLFCYTWESSIRCSYYSYPLGYWLIHSVLCTCLEIQKSPTNTCFLAFPSFPSFPLPCLAFPALLNRVNWTIWKHGRKWSYCCPRQQFVINILTSKLFCLVSFVFSCSFCLFFSVLFFLSDTKCPIMPSRRLANVSAFKAGSVTSY